MFSVHPVRWKYQYSPESCSVEHHNCDVLSSGVGGVVLYPPQQLLDNGMSGVDLQGLLLVEVVVSLHVLGLGVGLGLDDLLHVSGPTEPGSN